MVLSPETLSNWKKRAIVAVEEEATHQCEKEESRCALNIVQTLQNVQVKMLS
jgi:hypothetical protein